jgi:hypothetical protein
MAKVLISERRLKCLLNAEKACRELRFQIARPAYLGIDFHRICNFMQDWLDLAPKKTAYTQPTGVTVAEKREKFQAELYERHKAREAAKVAEQNGQ